MELPQPVRALGAVEGGQALVELCRGKRVAVLTGAGCSTESGIPDYRGEGTRRRAKAPVQYRAFVSDPVARRRYWARALSGWRRFAGKRPNPAHEALAALQCADLLTGLVTQNVDGLHQEAGSHGVVELHGALSEVVCLGCGDIGSRHDVQRWMEQHNPAHLDLSAPMAPDGDADLDEAFERSLASFLVPTCRLCDAPVKPHVVFFGESVPKTRVEQAWSIVNAADVLLVVGSSLAVYSGYRFVRGARERQQPVALVNLGDSRGDAHATVRVAAKASAVLSGLAKALCP